MNEKLIKLSKILKRLGYAEEADKINNLIRLGTDQSTIIAYHGGRDLEGDSFSFKYSKTGEGYSALGPGIYFSDNEILARRYCKYSTDPIIYTVSIDSSGLYNPISGEPKKFIQPIKDLVESELKIQDPYRGVSRLTHGPGYIGTIFKALGPEEGRQALKNIGITGAIEELPSGAHEIAIYDLSTIQIISKTKCILE